jgi:hypothetical protein
LLSVRNLDQRNLVLGAESDDELLVCLLLAGLVQDAHVGGLSVQVLGCLAETTGKTIVDESNLQNSLKSLEDGELSLSCGVSRDLDLIGLDNGGFFYVRLRAKLALESRCRRSLNPDRLVPRLSKIEVNHTILMFLISSGPRRIQWLGIKKEILGWWFCSRS